MTATIVAYAFLFLLVASVIGVGWWQIYDHGQDNAEARETKKDAKAKQDTIDALKAHPLSPDEQRTALRRLRKRLKNLRS